MTRSFQSFTFFLCATLLFISCGETSKRESATPLQAVASVDLDRYLGTWYEIARFPFSIQEGCHGTTATYERRDDGKISVLNRCLLGSFDGHENVAKGTAWAPNAATPSKLKVTFNFFMGLFGGSNYWIIDLAPDYSYSVVSEPEGRYLWILSRTPQLNDEIYESILARLKTDGFKTEFLQKTPQR